jgi:DNA repair photolyase
VKPRSLKPERPRDTTPFEAPPDWQAPKAQALRGRGTSENPEGRFERLYQVEDLEAREREEREKREGGAASDPPVRKTQYLRDASRSVLAGNTSPDINYNLGLNPYRGCEHGCVYCYARPTHEYLGMSAGLDFETKILVKEDAPQLLRKELAKRSYRPQTIGISGVTDPYQPVERVLKITRGCLEVLAECRNPVGLITKNSLITRDIDHLRELAGYSAVSVHLSVTTLNADLHRVMEPRASHPTQRLRAIEALAKASVPVGVMIGPVIPGLSDHEIPAILEAAANAGASYANHVILRLPGAVEQLFPAWLERHFPDRRDKVLNRLRSLRGGELHDSRFYSRMSGEGVFAKQIHRLFEISRRRVGLRDVVGELSSAHFRRPTHGQLDLF